MRITAKDRPARPVKTDALVLFALQGEEVKLPGGVKLPTAALSDYEGEFRKTRVNAATGGPAKHVILVGLGKPEACDAEKLRRAAAMGIKVAEGRRCRSAALWCTPAVQRAAGGPEAAGAAAAEGVALGAYRYVAHKSEAKAAHLKAVTLFGSGLGFRRGAGDGRKAAEAACFARDLQNAPGNCMRPRDLASQARKLARASDRITCRVLDEAAMDRLGMGALLGVSRGSREPARLVHLVYRPARARKGAPKVALVGKGLTFDAGGISLKPAGKMWDMKYDMSGGAAVLGVFHGLARLGAPCEVHGIVPASENLLGAAAQKPGDVVRAMDGTTIEVLNTDAEGRLILADALAYAKKKVKPDTIIDLATLTGAVITALGHELSGMFATTDALRDALTRAGEATGETVWPLPLLECHKEQMKGEVADLRNINDPGQGNGSTAGAAFLAHFVGDTEWCHLDIAGTAWGARGRDYVGGAQGSGVGVRLLLRYLKDLV